MQDPVTIAPHRHHQVTRVPQLLNEPELWGAMLVGFLYSQASEKETMRYLLLVDAYEKLLLKNSMGFIASPSSGYAEL